MCKKMIILIMAAILMNIAAALPMCGELDTLPAKDCIMITPSLICPEYTYSIINSTGATVKNSSLQNLTSGIFYFNFTQGQGEYIIQLCDGSTKQVIVEDEKMILGIDTNLLIMVSLFLITIFTFIIASRSKGIYKAAIGLTGLSFIGLSIMLPDLIEQNTLFASTALLISILSWVFIAFGIVCIYLSIVVMISNLFAKKEK